MVPKRTLYKPKPGYINGGSKQRNRNLVDREERRGGEVAQWPLNLRLDTALRTRTMDLRSGAEGNMCLAGLLDV